MLNAGWMTDYEKVMASLVENVGDGWIPQGADSPAVIFDHEFAHVFDSGHGIRNDKRVHDWFNAAKEAGELPSKYAGHDVKEFIAEAWIDYSYNPAPTKYGRLIGEMFESMMEGD